jgi:hypothetical protein
MHRASDFDGHGHAYWDKKHLGGRHRPADRELRRRTGEERS